MLDLDALADALIQTRRLLQQHGDIYTAQRLQGLEGRLKNGDTSAIVSAVSEATGGMGSLNDRQLSVANGDAIQPHDVASANTRLRALVKEVEQRARQAAAAHDIRLIR